MKITAGNYYRTAEWRVFGPMRRRETTGPLVWTDGDFGWTEEGKHFADGSSHRIDLVAEWTGDDNPEQEGVADAPDAPGPVLAPGMTLRDWFAGQALAGFLASPNHQGTTLEVDARDAYRVADAMIAERGK